MSPENNVNPSLVGNPEQAEADPRSRLDVLLAKLAKEEDAMEMHARETYGSMTDEELETSYTSAEASFLPADRELVEGFDPPMRTEILGMHDKIDLGVSLRVGDADFSDQLGVKKMSDLGPDVEALVIKRMTEMQAMTLAEERYPKPDNDQPDSSAADRQRLMALLKMPSDEFYSLYNRWSDQVLVNDELAARESEADESQLVAKKNIEVTDGSTEGAPVGGVEELNNLLKLEASRGVEHKQSLTESLDEHWQQFKKIMRDPGGSAARLCSQVAAFRYNKQRSKEAESSDPGVGWRTKIHDQIGRAASLAVLAKQAAMPAIKEGLSAAGDALLHPNDAMLRTMIRAESASGKIFSSLSSAREKMSDTGEIGSRMRRKHKIGVAALGFAAAGAGAYLAYRGFSGSGSVKHFNEAVSGNALPAPRGEDFVSAVGTHEITQSFSPEARLTRPGEGWYRTIQQVTGIDNPKYQQNILNEIGPKLGQTGDAYRMGNGEWGITKPGKLSDRALELISKTAKSRNYIK